MNPPRLREDSIEMDRRKWHFDKSINVPTVVAIVMMIAAGLGYVMHQDRRQTISEEKIITLKETDSRHENELRTLQKDIRSDILRIEAKIDNLRGPSFREGR